MSELNVTKRGDKWQYRFEGASIGGKRKQYSKSGFASKKEAVLEGTKALNDYNASGAMIAPSTCSYSDFLDYWFEMRCTSSVKYSTQILYRRMIEKHIKPGLGKYKLANIKKQVLVEYLRSKADEGYSNSFLKDITGILKNSFEFGVEVDFLKQNPMVGIKKPSVVKEEQTKREREIITIEQYNTIMFYCPSKYKMLFELGWNCGLRIAEALALQWSDINFSKKTITIHRQLLYKAYASTTDLSQKSTDRNYFTDTKTSRPRTISIPNSLITSLKLYRTKQKESEMLCGEFYPVAIEGEHRSVISTSKGLVSKADKLLDFVIRWADTPFISITAYRRTIRTLQAKTGYSTFDYHTLRHTHATMLIENGVSVKTVQERLGHTKIETTLDNYVHNTSVMQDEATALMDKVNLSCTNGVQIVENVKKRLS